MVSVGTLDSQRGRVEKALDQIGPRPHPSVSWELGGPGP